MKRLYSFLVVAILLIAIPIQGDSAGKDPLKTLVSANSSLGFGLLGKLTKASPDENVFISPPGIAMALAMTYNGASGATQRQMAKTLGIASLDITQLNLASKELLNALQHNDKQVTLKIANSLWASQLVPFQQSFMSTVANNYGAKIENLDFQSPKSLKEINNWVKKATDGQIPKIIEKLRPGDVLVLINALFFDGKWSTPFERKLTKTSTFKQRNGSTKELPFMHRNDDIDYYRGPGFQAVQLPYGDGRFRIYLLLPDRGTKLSSLLDRIGPKSWKQWQAGFAKRPGRISLPRFTIEYKVELNQALEALGMKDAFNPVKAQFSGLVAGEPNATNTLFINTVLHKSKLEIDEAGTKAAAATAVTIGVTSAAPRPPFQLEFDRPFMCILQDSQTGSILFLGTITNPKKT